MHFAERKEVFVLSFTEFGSEGIVDSNSSLNQVQGCQVLLNFSTLLLKLHCCYWNFHEILAKILKFVLFPLLFSHKNTGLCVKLCKNTEISAICYWSEFPDVGNPASGNGLTKYRR